MVGWGQCLGGAGAPGRQQVAANVDLAAYTIGCAVLYRDIQIDQRANQKFSTKEQVKWNGLSAEKRMKCCCLPSQCIVVCKIEWL